MMIASMSAAGSSLARDEVGHPARRVEVDRFRQLRMPRASDKHDETQAPDWQRLTRPVSSLRI